MHNFKFVGMWADGVFVITEPWNDKIVLVGWDLESSSSPTP